MEFTRSQEKRSRCHPHATLVSSEDQHVITEPRARSFLPGAAGISTGQVPNQETDIQKSQHSAPITINGPIISGYIRAAEEHFPCTKMDHIRRSWITGPNLLLRLLRHLLHRHILTVEKSYFPPKQQKDIKAPPSLDLTRRHFRVNHSTERISTSTL